MRVEVGRDPHTREPHVVAVVDDVRRGGPAAVAHEVTHAEREAGAADAAAERDDPHQDSAAAGRERPSHRRGAVLWQHPNRDPHVGGRVTHPERPAGRHPDAGCREVDEGRALLGDREPQVDAVAAREVDPLGGECRHERRAPPRIGGARRIHFGDRAGVDEHRVEDRLDRARRPPGPSSRGRPPGRRARGGRRGRRYAGPARATSSTSARGARATAVGRRASRRGSR